MDAIAHHSTIAYFTIAYSLYTYICYQTGYKSLY